MTAPLLCRDLDRFIEENVFNRHVHDWERLNNQQSPIARKMRMVCTTCKAREWSGYARTAPRYSGSPRENEILIDEMFERGYSLYLYRSQVGELARFEKDGERSGYSNVFKYPAPKSHYEAIARAALDALGLLPKVDA
jgi:hypothetical protein